MPGWRHLRFVVASTLLGACNDPLVTTDSSGTGSASRADDDDDDDDDDDGPSSLSDPDTTPADSGDPIDLGSTAPEPVTLCPPPSVSAVGIDTRVRVTFDDDDFPVLLSRMPISVVCDGQPISGETLTHRGQLVFVPGAVLPSDTSCDVELLADSVALDDVPVAPIAWSFTTGTGYGLEFDFATPITVSDGHALNTQAVDADGDDVVLTWFADGGLTVARSSDRGESFELSPLDAAEGFLQMPDIHLQDGVVHVVWQILDGNNDGQCFYSRSEPGLGEMSEPLHLVALPQPMTSAYPSVATDAAGHVVVTWVESCYLGEPCPLEDEGLYMITSDDGGATFDAPTRVLGREAWGYAELYGPRLGWVDGGVAGVWTAYPDGVANGITVVDGGAGFSVIAEFDGAQQRFPELDRTFQDEVAMHWIELDRDGLQRRMLARVRERAAVGIDPPIVIAESFGTSDFVTTVDVHGDIVAVTATEGGFIDEPMRYLKLSRDGGQTFSAVQWIDFMATTDIEADVEDSLIPLIAVADDERAHLTWYHFEADTYSVRYTHGDVIEPCGLKSAR